MKRVSLGRFRLALVRHLRQVGVHHGAQPRAGPHRFFLANSAAHLVEARLQQLFRIKRRPASQQFVEQHAQA